MLANVYCNDSVTLPLHNKRIPLNTLQHSSCKDGWTINVLHPLFESILLKKRVVKNLKCIYWFGLIVMVWWCSFYLLYFMYVCEEDTGTTKTLRKLFYIFQTAHAFRGVG